MTQICRTAWRFHRSDTRFRLLAPRDCACRCRPSPGVLAAALGFLLVAVAAPAVAQAAPLMETEPNNTPLQANGPFGPEGFVSTINVSDDVDFVIFRLGGERQVSATFSALSGCNSSGNYVYANITDSAGHNIASLAASFSSTRTQTWTTPRDATEYRVRLAGLMGCQTLLTVGPADALITGPLPAPAFNRTLTVSAPTQVGQGVAVPVTATGSAAEEDRVAALWTTGGCPVTPDENASGIVLGNLLATGPYTVTLTTTSPQAAGTATLCTWLYDTLGVLDPLLRQQNVVVGPLPPAAPAPTPPKPATPAPPARSYPRPPASVTLQTTHLQTGSTRITSLVVLYVPRSYAVRFTCSGAGCRSHISGTFYAAPRSATLSLTASVRGMHLAPGAKLAIKVSRTGYQSHILSYTMRAGLPPLRVSQCENPGATTAFAC